MNSARPVLVCTGVEGNLDFDAAIGAARAVVSAEAADPLIRPGGHSRVLSHGSRTRRSVLLLHGYTHTPAQFDGLAATYFARGYNVWIPRAPNHGTTDPAAQHLITATALLRYADAAMTVAAALGEEPGVVGISGGAVLATWLGQAPDGAVRDLLLLSPFFAPDPAHAPAAMVRPMTVLYGRRLLPDRFTSRGYSMRAASQYLRIARQLGRPRRTALRSIAVAISERDGVVDPAAAIRVPRGIADANGIPLGVLTLPAALGIGHDTLGHDTTGPELYARYLELYENGAGENEAA